MNDRESDLERKAREFAERAHAKQVRKYTGEPYVNHCREVADIVRRVDHTEVMLAAAWLHDTVEDCGVSSDTIYTEFGVDVGILVDWLTDVSKPEDGNRHVRKTIDRNHTANASVNAKTIKLADLISNTSSIVQHDPNFARVYLGEKRQLLQVLIEGDPILFGLAFNALVDGEERLAHMSSGQMV